MSKFEKFLTVVTAIMAFSIGTAAPIVYAIPPELWSNGWSPLRVLGCVAGATLPVAALFGGMIAGDI